MKDFDSQARQLHEWYCTVTRQKIPLRMDTLLQWSDWIQMGYSGSDMQKVLRYLQGQIRANKRNHGALSLRQLLNLENFEKDLGLAQMASGGFLHEDARVTAPPDAPKREKPVSAPPRAIPDAPLMTDDQRAIVGSILQQFKQQELQ